MVKVNFTHLEGIPMKEIGKMIINKEVEFSDLSMAPSMKESSIMGNHMERASISSKQIIMMISSSTVDHG